MKTILRYFKILLVSNILLITFSSQASEQVFTAIAKADVAALKVALALPEAADSRNARADTPLLAAARTGNIEMLDLILQHGADINQLDSARRDILNIAISLPSVEMVRWALANRIDPTMVTSVYQGSALIYACHQGQVEIVNLLLKEGAPVDRINNLGWTALLETTILGDGSPSYQQITQLLLDAGANAAIADRAGKTPLEHALERGHGEIAAILRGSK